MSAVTAMPDAGTSEQRAAEAVGALLADQSAVLLCGGLGGVMEAACRGAKALRVRVAETCCVEAARGGEFEVGCRRTELLSMRR